MRDYIVENTRTQAVLDEMYGKDPLRGNGAARNDPDALVYQFATSSTTTATRPTSWSSGC